MKKIIVLVFIFFLVFILSSCGDKTTPVANYNENPPMQIHSPAPGGENTAPTETGTQDTIPGNQTVIPDEGTPTTASDPVADDEPPPETDSPTPTPDVGNTTSTGTGTENTIPDNQSVIPGQGTSTAVNDPIRDILGVDYTINPTEYTITSNEGIYRLRHVEIHGELNLNDFVMDFWGNIGVGDSIIPTKTGDVLLITFPGNEFLGGHRRVDPGQSLTILFINLGGSQFSSIIVNTGLIPTPIETVGYELDGLYINWPLYESRTAVENEQFGMLLIYTSPHFYWYSTDANAVFLQQLKELAEISMPQILKLLGITELTQKISIFYYDRDTFTLAYPTATASFARQNGMSLQGYRHMPFSEDEYLDFMLSVLIHEAVHVLQVGYFPNTGGRNYQWIHEGTANYFQWGWHEFNWLGDDPRLREPVTNNQIPTLDCLEEYFYSNKPFYYAIARVSVISFIIDTWGMNYMIQFNRQHGNYEGIFGITRTEFERQWHQWLRLTYGDPS
jgi:hypothetical protein